ncbi:transketolase [bacterium]|jgi:transketolase|nr:transketolase [bacterium]
MTPAARQIRENIIRVSQHSGHGHIPTCFSIVEMLLAVYGEMRHDPSRPDWPERDIFILSKGHASLGHYTTLAELGYFPVDDVYAFGAHHSKFGCHADRLKVPGIEASTGSLGHGIGLGVGMALAFKLDQSSRRVFVIVGDGEANEGSVWEAIMVATHQQLSNLTILYDNNGSQARCMPIPNPAERLAAFGCDVHEVPGHDEQAIGLALRAAATNVKAIVCHTQKGHGCKTLTDDMFAWHRRSPKADEAERMLEELHASAV